jgi:4-hydroxybenzoate polyprenyltransferase
MLWKTIKNYLKLIRIHSAVLSGIAPVCIAASTGENLTIFHYIELFFIGLLFHTYFFVLNELKDIEFDKKSKDLSKKPLVDGSIKIENARYIVILSMILIVIFSIIFFYDQILILLVVSLAGFLFGGLYDFYGKKLPHADYFVALTAFFIALYGGFSVTTSLGLFPFIITLLALVQAVINNIIAGLKDVDHDFMASGLSTPLRMKVRVEGEFFLVSKSFIAYMAILKIAHIFLTILPFTMNLIIYENWQFYMVIILIFIAVIFMIRFLTIKKFEREKIIRAIGFHEMFAFMVVPLMLYGFIGPLATIFLLVFPIIWLGVFLIIMYGRLMPGI